VATLEQTQRESAAREATLREEAGYEAERLIAAKVAEVEQRHRTVAAELESRLAQPQADRATAEEATAIAKAQLEEQLDAVRTDAAAQMSLSAQIKEAARPF
jgi:hypothetical protein